jgi:lambda family phage portal protein
MSVWSRIFSRKTAQAAPTQTEPAAPNPRTEIRDRFALAFSDAGGWFNPISAYTGEKYGTIDYRPINGYAYATLRRNSRGVFHDSTIARGIVKRLNTNVINVGLTWESAPLWALIPDAPKDEADRYAWTQEAESLWKLYTSSREADIEGRLTFMQIQRFAYVLNLVDGEVFGILRYLSDPKRMSPVAVQFIRPEQVVDPTDATTVEAITGRGGRVDHGVEYASGGDVVAVHVRDSETGKTTRISIFGPKTGRRFVIHSGDFETVGQARGLPRLSAIIYELKRLTDYDIAELEATVAAAAWLASVEAHVDAVPGRGPKIQPNVSNRETGSDKPQSGLEVTRVNKMALIMNHPEPGYTTKFTAPSRPNPNYQAFVDALLSNIGGSLGIPLSVVKQKFDKSYSAARAEILFFWNTVMQDRADFTSGFLAPFHAAWFSEAARAQVIKAPGFANGTAAVRQAWLYGMWNGISRPSVDPLKEVNAIEKRLNLGHTTGEREAKAYNGSDYRENVERLATENVLLADANAPLQPAPAPQPEPEPDDTEVEVGRVAND